MQTPDFVMSILITVSGILWYLFNQIFDENERNRPVIKNLYSINLAILGITIVYFVGRVGYSIYETQRPTSNRGLNEMNRKIKLANAERRLQNARR